MAENSSPKNNDKHGTNGLEYVENQNIGLQVIRSSQPQGTNQQGAPSLVQHPAPHVQGVSASSGSPVKAVHVSLTHEDEISTFFRNRQMGSQGSFGTSPVIKLAAAMVFVLGVLIISWNLFEPVRTKTQHFSMDNFKVNLGAHMPAWTKKAKAFQRKVTRDAATAGSNEMSAVDAPGGSTVVGTLDPLYLAVVSGLWRQVESFNAARCPRWQPTHDCGVRAFYYAYRGMRSSLKPLQTMDISARSGISQRDRVMFLFAKSASLPPPQSQQIFMEAINVAAGDKSIARLIFDARFKSMLREGRPGDVSSMIALLSRLPMDASDIAKWKALELSSKLSSKLSSNVLGQVDTARTVLHTQFTRQVSLILQKYPGVLKADPMSFLAVSGHALRLGLSKPIAVMSGMMASESATKQFDPGLRRDLAIVNARALLLGGDAAAASERLIAAQKQDGADAVTNHLLGVAFLEMRTAAKASDAARFFQAAFKSQGAWQSAYGYFMALIRSKRTAEAGHMMGALRRFRQPSNDVWIDMAFAEYDLALAKAKGGGAARYQQVANMLSGGYARHPDWVKLAELYADALANSGKASEAQKIRAKLDDESSKTSYLSSPELMESPIGPLALLK